jgi:hypothetical protein
MATRKSEVKVRCDRCVHWQFERARGSTKFGWCKDEQPAFIQTIGSDFCRMFEAKEAE